MAGARGGGAGERCAARAAPRPNLVGWQGVLAGGQGSPRAGREGGKEWGRGEGSGRRG